MIDRVLLTGRGRLGVSSALMADVSMCFDSEIWTSPEPSDVCPLCSSSILLMLPLSDRVKPSSSMSRRLGDWVSTKVEGRLFGVHGRLRAGVFGGSGKSTVKSLLNGQGVSSYCSTLANTFFSSSALCLSSTDEFGNSIR